MNNFMRRVDFMGNVLNEDLELNDEVEKTEENIAEVAEEPEEEVKSSVKGKDFFKAYNDSILKAVRELTGPEMRFLLTVCAMMSWDNSIVFTKKVKEKLMYHLDIKNEGSIRNLIVSLSKKGFLKRADVRVYIVNDAFFTRQAEPHIKAKRKSGKIHANISTAQDDTIN